MKEFKIKPTKKIKRLSKQSKSLEALLNRCLDKLGVIKTSVLVKEHDYIWNLYRKKTDKLFSELRKQIPDEYKDKTMRFKQLENKVIIHEDEESN